MAMLGSGGGGGGVPAGLNKQNMSPVTLISQEAYH
jgi:hypothetical protein